MDLEKITIGEQLKEVKDRLAKYEPITIEQIQEVLNLTIKKDDENKIVTFLAMLAAYTDNAQFNISFNAPSSSGKSFIPLEIASLFPKEDVIKLGNASPTSFLHESGIYNKETNERLIDLSRKIIIFLDMPHTTLLERLRSLLSHDEKEMRSKITDKTEKGGTRTKTVIIRGFPTVIFCSANARMDQQEMTRFILLSPQINTEKILAGIHQSSMRESDKKKYYKELNNNPLRKSLIERIAAIKAEGIEEVIIENQKIVQDRFLAHLPNPQPRNQRDIKRVYSIIKAVALLNPWSRKREGSTLYASEYDIDTGFEIWNKISLCQELEVSPYLYEFYKLVILALWDREQIDEFGDKVPEEEKIGVNRQEMLTKYCQVYGGNLGMIKLRHDYLPNLESAGLIYQEQDPNDRRQLLTYPAYAKRKSDTLVQGYSEPDQGVKNIGDIPFENVPF